MIMLSSTEHVAVSVSRTLDKPGLSSRQRSSKISSRNIFIINVLRLIFRTETEFKLVKTGLAACAGIQSAELQYFNMPSIATAESWLRTPGNDA